uniref:Uncharacterized protein n=1 Tax=Araneus ventricosus TaxID=182803 RepID=A0A4Y2AC55_ARAVE|nr:hypothetical protein AVEN_10308-1 [Araneus ventricosus]
MTSGDHPSCQDQSITLWWTPNSDAGSRTEIGHLGNCLLPDKSVKTELPTTAQRAGSKVLFKLELWRDREMIKRSLGESR